MNDSTDNPFGLPDIDQEDIPVLDDIVTPGSAHENRTPAIPEQATPELADYNFDANAAPADENSSTEETTPEETHNNIGHVALDTGFSIEDQNNEGINEDNIASELPVDQEQLTELIEQITNTVQHELKPQIEELIQESIRTQLTERLPDIFNNTPPTQED